MKYIGVHILILLLTGCISSFVPDVEEKTNNLVVESLITDQNKSHKIKISRAVPLGKQIIAPPVKGCEVTIIDENNIEHPLKETSAGTYSTDSLKFHAKPGGIYTLKINTGSLTYISSPVEMLPVPPIDSLFYEKKVLVESNEWGRREEGCQIYLNTYDPLNRCRFFRWNFTETWEINLRWENVNNRICWITQKSENIMIRSTTAYNQSRITKLPVRFITNKTDMLSVKYSILVNQYSLNEDEFSYWVKLKNISEKAGGLFDVIPSAIMSNIYNVDDPEEVVLGYFSVSALAQKRIFIRERFSGLADIYWYCPTDTVWGEGEIIGLNDSLWLLEDHPLPDLYTGTEFIRMRVITRYIECADCTTRGITKKPPYWDSETLN